MKTIIGLCIILIGINIYLIWENSAQKKQIARIDQENNALLIYLETMQEKIKQFETEQAESIEIPKELRIRELLDSYLRERDQQQIPVEGSISTEELRTEMHDYQLKQRFIPNLVPVKADYAVSQGFSTKHKAIDIAAPLGAEVITAAAGVIKSVYEDKYFGNVIVIDHLNNYLTFYAHLAKSFHQTGFFVEKGDTIGLVGSTGFSTNPHLHFEVIYRGENTDPQDLADYRQ